MPPPGPDVPLPDRRRHVLGIGIGIGIAIGIGIRVGTAVLPWPASAAGPAPFVFGTDTEETSVYGLLLRRIHAEALRRMDLRLVVAVYPTKRLGQMADEGGIDGEMVRAPAYAAAHPEMIRVDEPLEEVVFGVYSAKADAGMKRVEDLIAAGRTGIYRRGVVACETALKPLFPAARLHEVTTAAQGLRMLASGRVDFFCEIDSSIWNERHSTPRPEGTEVQKLFNIGTPVPLNPYLHRRHASLVPQLAATLRQMKAEGLVAQYRLEAIRHIERANEPARAR